VAVPFADPSASRCAYPKPGKRRGNAGRFYLSLGANVATLGGLQDAG